MKNLELDFLKNATAAQILSQAFLTFKGVGTDTRKDLSGQLFIALKGDQFDAHNFVEAAVEKGVHGILIHEWRPEWEKLKSKVTIIKVTDTLTALQEIARGVRRQLGTKILALTGSNGKTTTKEFTAAILETRKQVHYSKGSFNNHWGLPFSILELEPKHEIAVLEMGMNHAGEIQRLVEIAEPDVVVCTTVGTAHIEHFGTQEKIAAAKEEIYLYSPPEAIRIYNIDDPFTIPMCARGKKNFPDAKILTFSNHRKDADVFLEFESMTLNEIVIRGHIHGEEGRVNVKVFGRQNLVNLAAASALSLAAGLAPQDIWSGLNRCRTNWGRNQLLALESGAQMIFDGYNANPDSMKALLENVKNVKVEGKKIGVFGEMLEMGKFAGPFHQDIAEVAAKSGFDSIYFVGEDFEAFNAGLKNGHYEKKSLTSKQFDPAMAQTLAKELRQGDLVVVKGSRGMKLERFVLPCQPLAFDLKKE